MNKIYNILIFPGGTEIGLEIYQALRWNKDINLFSAGSKVSNHAPYVFKHHFVIPSVHEKNWIEKLNIIVDKYKIDYIYPAYDEIIYQIAVNRKKIHCPVILPSTNTCKLTRSKMQTYNKLSKVVPVPRLYSTADQIDKWPVFLKPDRGQGSERTFLARDITEYQSIKKRNPDLITLEYLSGPEYTIDCFSNNKHELLFAGGRERVRTKSGISMNSRMISNPAWKNYASKISKALDLKGAWFFQMKRNSKGVLKLLEVAPRIGGTMATHRVLGVNFPLLSIYVHDGKPVKILSNKYKVTIDRSLCNKYKVNLTYKTVYLDFDDTLIINDKVNTSLLSFVYQCKEKGKKIILITKSRNNIYVQLKKYFISPSLFDEIYTLKQNDDKFKLIKPKEAIFIDDSFSERTNVDKKNKIPTFDCSMIEALIDNKI